LAAHSEPPGDFWAETQKLRKIALEGGKIHAVIHGST